MTGVAPATTRVFISYAHADDALGKEFEQHLAALRHAAEIEIWVDRRLSPGSEWNRQIRRELEAAHVIVLLVSPAFLASRFIREQELPRAMERHRAGEATVVPVLLRPCAWEETPLGMLQGLPPGLVPIDRRRELRLRNQAWTEVVRGILTVVRDVKAARAQDGDGRTRPADDVPTPDQYLAQRATQYRDFSHPPLKGLDLTISGDERVDRLRFKLMHGADVKRPMRITVRGTLFPCALLTSGWWERHLGENQVWHGWQTRIQHWLFNGFDLWAPSWDFTWAIAAAGTHHAPTRFVAQLGSGDEADSLPVFFSPELAARLAGHFTSGWGGIEANVSGLLGHRRHFKQHYHEADCFGGLLDFCLWVDGGAKGHGVERVRGGDTTLYSGYVWKCVAPLDRWEHHRPLHLSDVYFVWDHTNFASKDAVAYSLDALAHKERYIERTVGGPLVLLQKSSALVPGDCKFSPADAYDIIIRGGAKTV